MRCLGGRLRLANRRGNGFRLRGSRHKPRAGDGAGSRSARRDSRHTRSLAPTARHRRRFGHGCRRHIRHHRGGIRPRCRPRPRGHCVGIAPIAVGTGIDPGLVTVTVEHLEPSPALVPTEGQAESLVRARRRQPELAADNFHIRLVEGARPIAAYRAPLAVVSYLDSPFARSHAAGESDVTVAPAHAADAAIGACLSSSPCVVFTADLNLLSVRAAGFACAAVDAGPGAVAGTVVGGFGEAEGALGRRRPLLVFTADPDMRAVDAFGVARAAFAPDTGHRSQTVAVGIAPIAMGTVLDPRLIAVAVERLEPTSVVVATEGKAEPLVRPRRRQPELTADDLDIR